MRRYCVFCPIARGMSCSRRGLVQRDAPPIVVVAKSAKLRFPRRHKLRIPRSGHAGQNSFTSRLRLSPPRGARRGPLLVLPEKKTGRTRKGYAASVSGRAANGCAIARSKRKGRLTRSGAVALRARRGSAYRCKRRFRLAFGHAILFCDSCDCCPVADGADLVGVQGRI